MTCRLHVHIVNLNPREQLVVHLALVIMKCHLKQPPHSLPCLSSSYINSDQQTSHDTNNSLRLYVHHHIDGCITQYVAFILWSDFRTTTTMIRCESDVKDEICAPEAMREGTQSPKLHSCNKN